MRYWKSVFQHSSTPTLRCSCRFIALDLDGDVHARREIELLQFIHGLGGRVENVNQPLVRALLESFLRFLVAMGRALDGEALDAGGKRDGPGDARAGAFDGVGDFARRLVYDALVISLEPNANALSIHTKNNCLLNLSENSAPLPGKAEAQSIKHPRQCNIFFKVFWFNRNPNRQETDCTDLHEWAGGLSKVNKRHCRIAQRRLGSYRMSQNPFRLSAKVVIVDADGRVLLLKRSRASKNNAGTWEFPGGKTDPGETFDQALLREVNEETGLQISLEHVVGAGEADWGERKIAYLFLEARHVNGAVRLSEEHDAFVWVKPSELPQQNLAPQFKEFAAGYARRSAGGMS